MINNIDQDVEITLVDDTQRRMNEEDMFGVNNLDGGEVVVDVKQSVKVVEKEVSTADPVTITGDVVTTQILFNNTMKWIEAFVPIETELVKGSDKAVEGSKKAEEGSSKRVACKLEQGDAKRQRIEKENESAKLKRCLMQDELEEELRLERQKEEETNIDLVAKWDNIQFMMDADCELATRLQEEERGDLSIKEKSSDKAVEGSKKAEEGSSKRAACKLEQGDAKRQRIEKENESAKLKRCLVIILEDDDVKIEATPLSFKSPTIFDYKIYKEGKKSFFKIIKADETPSYVDAADEDIPEFKITSKSKTSPRNQKNNVEYFNIGSSKFVFVKNDFRDKVIP
nr:hypothetical protein [Tanacetum cinerariifolium]